MHIEVHTDQQILGKDLTELVRRWTEPALIRFSGQVTRLDVQIRADHGVLWTPDPNRCTLEVQCGESPPNSVVHRAKTMESAVRGASWKLERLLDAIIVKAEPNDADENKLADLSTPVLGKFGHN